MKISEIFEHILEQEDDDWGIPLGRRNNINQPEDTGDEEPEDTGDEEPEDTGDEEPENIEGDNQAISRERVQSRRQVLIQKWKEEVPGLNDDLIREQIDFFYRRKNNFRPFNGTLENPDPRNMPEITSFKQRYPDFPAENNDILRDITKYTWEQVVFLNNRFILEETNREQSFEIEGFTQEDRLRSAKQLWENFPARQKIVNDESMIVIRVESKSEAIGLGTLEHILQSKYPLGPLGNWCVTVKDNTWYNSYRTRTHSDQFSFYFVMDKTREENDEWYIGVISANKAPSSRRLAYKYTYVPRQNGEQYTDKWEDIARVWPNLADKEHLFVPFDTTEKEDITANLDKVNFRRGDRYDLAILSPRIQRLYIEMGNNIPSPRVFLSLNHDLQHIYVDLTDANNLQGRFISTSSDPFGILKSINKRDLRYLHEEILQNRLGIPSGVNAIKKSILKTNFQTTFKSLDNRYTIFQNRQNGKYGVFDFNKDTWVFKAEFEKTKRKSVFVRGKMHYVFKYESQTSDRVFYLLIAGNALVSKERDDPNRFKGQIVTKQELEQIIGRINI